MSRYSSQHRHSQVGSTVSAEYLDTSRGEESVALIGGNQSVPYFVREIIEKDEDGVSSAANKR